MPNDPTAGFLPLPPVLRGLVGWLVKACAVVSTVMTAIAGAMLAGAVAINFSNVLGRYLFLRPIEWAEEVMLYLMIGAVFAAVASVTWHSRHIRIGIALEVMAPKTRLALHVLVSALVVALSVQMLFAGLPVVSMLHGFGQRSEAAHVPMWIVHGAIQLGFFSIALMVTVRTLAELTGQMAMPQSVHDLALEEARDVERHMTAEPRGEGRKP